ncbi:LacI family DNA-binding transcriptional regulator [Psychromonas ingrahamii]|nr:LacI family DNA-binding transcriptional regulator [Psychromonas ingrahamii]
MNKKTTLKDVASELGISSSTVSRALNEKTKSMINAALVLKIEKTAAKMEYSINHIARSLKNGKKYTIGIIIPDLTNPVFGEISDEIIECLASSEYKAIIIFAQSNSSEYLKNIKYIASNQVDGFIFTNAYIEDIGVKYCKDHRIPCVTVGRTTVNKDISQIYTDNCQGMKLIIEHLVGLGHENIAFIAGPQDISDGYERLKYFEQWMKFYKANYCAKSIINTEKFSRYSGYKAADKLFNKKLRFTAIVAANDLLAVGIMDYLKEHDIICPREVSLVGFNAMLFSDVFSPPLTSVYVDRKLMAKQSVLYLLDALNKKNDAINKVKLNIVEPKLIIRDSTCPPRKIAMN